MQPIESSNRRSVTLPRVGLMVGIALFAAILLAPTPDSMRTTAARLERETQAVTAPQQTSVSTQPAIKTTTPNADNPAQRAALNTRAFHMKAAAAVTALIATWWICGTIPIAATSLLPIVLFPLLGVMRVDDTTIQYANHNIFLFMGGFILALAIERWGLHRRLALNVVNIFGTKRPRVVLGFMTASALLSMWISNTATAVMMLPIALAVVHALEQLDTSKDKVAQASFATALMLGTAYACSIGGIVTPIGTPPNIAFAGQFSRLFPDGPEIGFGMWMLLFAPLALVFIPATWYVLVRWVCPIPPAAAGATRDVIRQELARLPRLAGAERRVLYVFAAAAFLWITRSIPVGPSDYGWAALLERAFTPGDGSSPWFHAAYIKDASVAIGVAIVLFLLPGDRTDTGQRQPLMDWETAQRLPWDILLLFGGGFAIAQAFRVSGLSDWCGDAFAGLQIQHPAGLLAATCGMLTFLTEITSNTATTQVMLPIVAEAAPGLGVNPLLLMLAATISASCAFMLPVATPPNAIVYGSGYVEMKTMVRAGIILNLIGIVLVTLLLLFWVAPLLGINPTETPAWAR